MLCLITKTFKREEQQRKIKNNYMCNVSIPANADNKVVAGENAKVMTKEILEGIVESVVKGYIDDLVDETLCSIREGTTDFETDYYGDIWAVSFPFDEDAYLTIWDDIEGVCNDEGYDIVPYDWCEDNDIDLDGMISDMADEIVANNSELDWFEYRWAKYLGVFYKNKCDMVDEIREYVEKAAEEVFFTPMKTQFEMFFDEETMLEEDEDEGLIAVVGAFEGEEYNNVYNAVREQWENSNAINLDECCSIVDADIEDMIYDVVDTIVEDSRNMKWKDNSDRILGFIYNDVAA